MEILDSMLNSPLLLEEIKTLRKILKEIVQNPKDAKTIAKKALDRSNNRLRSLNLDLACID